MIPYDDLVIALTTWRARQGLPVGQLSGALTPPPGMVAAPVVHAGSGALSGSGRTAPPQRTSGSRPNVPPPGPRDPHDGPHDGPYDGAHDDALDVDDAALIEEHHDLGAESDPSETLLDRDLPSGDDTVDVAMPMASRTKPPAW